MDRLQAPPPVSDCVQIAGRRRATLALSTAVAKTSSFPGSGMYDVWCDLDCFVAVGDDSHVDGLTAANGYLLRANHTVPLHIANDHKLAGILAAGSGTLNYHRIG